MSLVDSNDVFQESWLLFFLSRLLGLRIIKRRHWRWISYFYAIILIVLYYTSFFIIKESIWHQCEYFQDVMYYSKDLKLQGYLNLFIFPAIIFSSIFKSSEDLGAYKILDHIDSILLYLNSPIDHEIEMKKEMIYLWIYVLINLLINLVTYFSMITADSGYIFDISWFLNSMPIFLETITLCGFDIFVQKIRVRFQQINRVIENLLVPKKISVIHVRSSDINNASKLRLARRIHLQLHDAASAINRAYELRLFLIFFVTLISVLNCFCKALDLLENYLQILDLSLYMIWIIFHLGKYLHIANSCLTATSEAKLVGGFFYEASITRQPDGMNEEIKALSRQLINRQLQFTIRNIISINFPKSLMICIAVLIYFFLLT